MNADEVMDRMEVESSASYWRERALKAESKLSASWRSVADSFLKKLGLTQDGEVWSNGLQWGEGRIEVSIDDEGDRYVWGVEGLSRFGTSEDMGEIIESISNLDPYFRLMESASAFGFSLFEKCQSECEFRRWNVSVNIDMQEPYLWSVSRRDSEWNVMKTGQSRDLSLLSAASDAFLCGLGILGDNPNESSTPSNGDTTS